MKSKVISIQPDQRTAEFIRIIAWRMGITADNEIKMMQILVNKGLFQPFHLNKYLKADIMKLAGINSNTFVGTIRRLDIKDAIRKNGKNYYVNPAFKGLDEIDAIVFR